MRILVVEDAPAIARALKEGLEQEGYAVDVENDGDNGLRAALFEPYDLIILDIMLPSKDGLAVCRELRENKVTTPVLMLTAKTQDGDVVTGLNAGADDYLAKPFSFEVLLARIRALLRRPGEVLADKLTIGDLTLDVTNRTAERANTPLDLSRKEFAILEYLLRHAEQACRKEDIMQHVWDFDADILPNTLEVFITYLRAKVDKPFSYPLIHTVRGFGYKISEKKL